MVKTHWEGPYLYANAPALYAAHVSNFTTTVFAEGETKSASKKILGYLEIGPIKVSVEMPLFLCLNVSKAS